MYRSSSLGARAHPGVRLGMALLLVLLLAAVGVWVLRSLGEDGPLDSSSPEERVFRTARLAGYDRVWVSESDGNATVVLGLPGVDSPADVEIAWQTGFASMNSAYPRAREYRVGLLFGDEVMVEMTGSAEEIADAIEADDAHRLRAVVTERYVVADISEEYLNSEAMAVSTTPEDAAYLDAKNRAAGLLDDEGPTVDEAELLGNECDSMRAAVGGKPAIEVGEALKEYSARIVTALDPSASGAERVLDVLGRLAEAAPAQIGAETIRLRTISLMVEALESESPYGSLLADTFAVAELVGASELAEGAASDAVLAAARDDGAPEKAVRLESFERAEELDIQPGGDPLRVVAIVVNEISGGAPIQLENEVVTVMPQLWEAYRRLDGTVFWQGETGTEFALTDGSLRGWAYSRGGAAVVNPDHVGTIFGLVASGFVER